MNDYINYSGGAKGADTIWETYGEKYGVSTIAFSFISHNTDSKHFIILTEKELEESDSYYRKASRLLKRKYPSNNIYVNNLLRRNWFQVKNADTIFAIGELIDNIVNGGTGWAVAMATIVNKPIYLFEQNKNIWMKYVYEIKEFRECKEPILTKKFAGIGTRKINNNGIKAIQTIYTNTFLY